MTPNGDATRVRKPKVQPVAGRNSTARPSRAARATKRTTTLKMLNGADLSPANNRRGRAISGSGSISSNSGHCPSSSFRRHIGGGPRAASHRALLTAALMCLASVPLLLAQEAARGQELAARAEVARAAGEPQAVSASLSRAEPELLPGGEQRLARQHFRLVSVAPSAQRKPTFKLVKIHKGRANGTTSSTTSAPSAPPRERPEEGGAPAKDKGALPRGSGKKIGSAALRKLLSQTLPNLNATSAPSAPSLSGNESTASASSKSGPAKAGPTFKFVFLQKAPGQRKEHAAASNSTGASASGATSASGGKTSAPRQQSLAASVSKQLASSLLYSAANLIGGDLNAQASSAGPSGLMPSLSALAALVSQQAGEQQANELASGSLKTAKGSPSAPTKTSAGGGGGDIRRLSEAAGTKTLPLAAGEIKGKPARKSRPARPSRIYNLPVKFVANGQPNHVVVFHTIKQHFATIKRLQQSVNGQAAPGSSGQASASGRRKRPGQQQQSERNRLKGKNSRLIYLPLKYLSNAKPHMLNVVMGTKASHKSEPATTAVKSLASRPAAA